MLHHSHTILKKTRSIILQDYSSQQTRSLKSKSPPWITIFWCIAVCLHYVKTRSVIHYFFTRKSRLKFVKTTSASQSPSTSMRNFAIVVPSKRTFDKPYTFPIIVFIISSHHFSPNTGLDTRGASAHTDVHKKRNPGLDYRSDGGSRVCYFHRWLFFVAVL